MMTFIIRIIDTINDWVGRIVGFLLIPLVLITAFEVFMRYVVKKPTIWSWDLNIQIFAAIVMLGGGYTMLHKGHVVVDVCVINMKPKARAILDLFTSVFFFFGIIVLLGGGWEMAMLSFAARETMPTIWAPPYYTMKMMVPIGAFLVLLQGISQFLKNIILVFSLNNKE
jgi:TRAP-type mannitol/chloroaromatic compound transport system permease small subunit